MSRLLELQEWYRNQCDGEWEHHHGVKIDSIDNPSWWVIIDLEKAVLTETDFTEIFQGVDADDHPVSDQWLHCCVKKTQFHGAGDPGKLEEIMNLFMNWANEVAN
jgi:hypothetical protein